MMAMMQVRVVHVGVGYSLVTMRVGMRLSHRSVVTMPMMLIVDVAMLMLQRFMFVLVGVTLRKINPKADAHQRPRDQQPDRQRLAKQDNREKSRR